MTKLSSLAALSAVVLASFSFSLAGCAEEQAPASPETQADANTETETETTVSAEEELKGAISFTTLSVKKSNAAEGLTVIESKAEYVAFFGSKPPASVDLDGDPCNPNPCGPSQTCYGQYPKCPVQPDGSVNPSCHPTAVCSDPPPPPADECATDADCKKGLHCQPQFVCVKAPCNSPLVCR